LKIEQKKETNLGPKTDGERMKPECGKLERNSICNCPLKLKKGGVWGKWIRGNAEFKRENGGRR